LKKRPAKLAVVRNSPERETSWRLRLFWPLLALLLISPVIAWKLSEKKIENSGRLEPAKINAKPGPWGELEYIPIAIEIPDHFVDVEQIDETDWIFKNFSHQQVVEFFKSCNLTPEQLDALLTKSKWNESPEACHVAPEDSLIESLSPESREKIYSALGSFPENVNEFYAFSYHPDQLAERLDAGSLQESTIAQFRKMLYPHGNIVRFADADVVLRKLQDRQERLRFIKTITRRASLLVKLKVTPKSDIDALLNYWGAGGRAKDLRPLLESLARVPDGCKIDIAHLLPPFARERIYTYPHPADDSQASREDCHWTSINFFNQFPSPVFASPEATAHFMKANYIEVGPGTEHARLGDVVCLKTSQDIVVHSAVYIADDILFSKNGAGLNQPWIYVKLDDMLPHYLIANETLTVVTYRRKQV
jgi:hypothetical protein